MHVGGVSRCNLPCHQGLGDAACVYGDLDFVNIYYKESHICSSERRPYQVRCVTNSELIRDLSILPKKDCAAFHSPKDIRKNSYKLKGVVIAVL